MNFLLRKGSFAINCARHIIFQKWFREKFIKCIGKRQNRKNLINSYHLSAHLLNDLGLDRDGKPTQWSTYSKPTHMSNEAHSVKAEKTSVCVAVYEGKHLSLQARM